MPVRADFHMHTEFSGDSTAPVRDMLDAAIERGMETVCITDHIDEDYPPDKETGRNPFLFDVEKYFQELRKIKEEYSGRLDVRIGVELGLQPHLGERYRALVSKYPFDFVIGSLHIIHGQDPYDGIIFQGRSDGDVYREAFQATLENLERVEDFDVLGHIDYVVRYGRHQAQEYSYRAFSDEIDQILKKVIEMGKGIEMNMGGFKYGLGFCNPHPDVIRRYRELGGEIITVGADAHRPEHAAYDFEKAGDILRKCGFRFYTEYRGRKPVFRPLSASAAALLESRQIRNHKAESLQELGEKCI